MITPILLSFSDSDGKETYFVIPRDSTFYKLALDAHNLTVSHDTPDSDLTDFVSNLSIAANLGFKEDENAFDAVGVLRGFIVEKPKGVFENFVNCGFAP